MPYPIFQWCITEIKIFLKVLKNTSLEFYLVHSSGLYRATLAGVWSQETVQAVRMCAIMLKFKEFKVYKISRLIQALTFWSRFWKKTSLTDWLFYSGLLELLLKHLTSATAGAWIRDYSDLLWQFLSGYLLQQQILSQIFCAVEVSSDMQKGRLNLWSQTNPRPVPIVMTFYQTTEHGHFLHFYFMIFFSHILFHRKWEFYPEILKVWNVSQRRWWAYSNWVIQNLNEQIICGYRVGTSPVLSEAGVQWCTLNLFFFCFLYQLMWGTFS